MLNNEILICIQKEVPLFTTPLLFHNFLLLANYTIPCAVIASTTFSKPAMLAPAT